MRWRRLACAASLTLGAGAIALPSLLREPAAEAAGLRSIASGLVTALVAVTLSGFWGSHGRQAPRRHAAEALTLLSSGLFSVLPAFTFEVRWSEAKELLKVLQRDLLGWEHPVSWVAVSIGLCSLAYLTTRFAVETRRGWRIPACPSLGGVHRNGSDPRRRADSAPNSDTERHGEPREASAGRRHSPRATRLLHRFRLPEEGTFVRSWRSSEYFRPPGLPGGSRCAIRTLLPTPSRTSCLRTATAGRLSSQPRFAAGPIWLACSRSTTLLPRCAWLTFARSVTATLICSS